LRPEHKEQHMDNARAFTVGKGADGTWQRQIVEMGV
jgi:hypothetical protein